MGRLDRCVSVEDFRQLAHRRLPRSVFEFVDGGAGQELTLRDNRAGFERIRLLPRVLTDVSRPDLTTTLWSRTYPTPLVISPMVLRARSPRRRYRNRHCGHGARHTIHAVDHGDDRHRTDGEGR